MAAPFIPVTGSASISATEFSFPNNSVVLVPITTAAEVETYLDLSALVAGDQYRIRAYETVNGTQGPVFEGYPTGVQGGPYRIPAMRLKVGWNITAKLITGSARTIGWSLYEDVGDVNALTASLSAGSITAATFATDAIDANALKADAVTEIQTGLGTAASLTSILGRLPAALVGGRMDSSVGAMAADVLTAAATAADFGTEVAAAVLAATIHSGWSVARALRVSVAGIAGKVTATATSFVARSVADDTDQISGTTDTSGNRSAITFGT